MNCQESKRVQRVLEEAIEGLRVLSHATPEWLIASRKIEHEVVDVMSFATHQHYVQNDSTAMIESTLDLWRLLQRDSKASEAFYHTADDASAEMLEMIPLFERLVHYIKKQLSVTVEEDRANAANFATIKQREEEAISEQEKLEQVLKLNRLEREKKMNDIQHHENSIRISVEAVQKEFEDGQTARAASASEKRTADYEEYRSAVTEKEAHLRQLEDELQILQRQNEEEIAALRTKQKQYIEDIEVVLHQMDNEMAVFCQKESDVMHIVKDLRAKIDDFDEQLQGLVNQRMDDEMAKQQELEAKRERERRERTLQKAVELIQTAWRAYKRKKTIHNKPKPKSASKKKSKK